MNLSHLLLLEYRHGIPRTDEPYGNLDLALRPFRMDEGVISRRDLNPVHANDLGVNHEP